MIPVLVAHFRRIDRLIVYIVVGWQRLLNGILTDMNVLSLWIMRDAALTDYFLRSVFFLRVYIAAILDMRNIMIGMICCNLLH